MYGSVLRSLGGDASLLEATQGSLHQFSANRAAAVHPRCHYPGAAPLGTLLLKVVAKSRGQIYGLWGCKYCGTPTPLRPV